MFIHQFHLYTDPVSRDTDKHYIILHLYDQRTTDVVTDVSPIMIQYRGAVTGLFTVYFGTLSFKGVMITNRTMTTPYGELVSNCTLLLSNGSLYSCTVYEDSVLFSHQFPISIGDTTSLFNMCAPIQTTSMDIRVNTDTYIGTITESTTDFNAYQELQSDPHSDSDTELQSDPEQYSDPELQSDPHSDTELQSDLDSTA